MKKVFSEDDLVKNLSLYYLNRHLKKKPMAQYHHEIDRSSLHEREKYKKKSELLLLNAFLHHYPEIKLENLTGESPDFIARMNGKKIGIELTEVINHLEIKKIECQLNKIFRIAEKELETLDTTKYCGVYFLEFTSLTLEDLLERSKLIIKQIVRSISKGKPYGLVKSLKKSSHRRNVFITHDYNVTLFDSLSSDKILNLIHKKNQKYPFYDQNVDECWLVIVSDMNSLASRYSFIQNKENLNEIESPFHRILHMENLCGNVLHIK